MDGVTMPEFPDIAPSDDWGSVLDCINTYAEAYAAAKVREAMEEAAQACEARIGTGNPGIDTRDCDAEATECAAAIRALTP